MWDDILFKKAAERHSSAIVIGSAMRGATLFPAVCLLVLLLAWVDSQSTINRAQTISNIFQIPIQTLTAISNFAQNTRPLGEILQRRRNQLTVQQQQQQQQQLPPPSSGSFQAAPVYNLPRSSAAKVAGLYTASDGSGFRI